REVPVDETELELGVGKVDADALAAGCREIEESQRCRLQLIGERLSHQGPQLEAGDVDVVTVVLLDRRGESRRRQARGIAEPFAQRLAGERALVAVFLPPGS